MTRFTKLSCFASYAKPLEDLYTHHFAGMTEQSIQLVQLEIARQDHFRWAATALSENERKFLLSIKQGKPDWSQLTFERLDQWPAIQWKLQNVRQVSARSQGKAQTHLREVLDL